MTSASHLSTNDAHVLTALFDPESTPNSDLHLDASLPSYPTIPSSTLASLRAAELAAINPLDTATPSPVAISQAIDALGAIVAREPRYASAYVNRAQARRLRLGERLFGQRGRDTEEEAVKAVEAAEEEHEEECGMDVQQETAEVLADLGTAITLATPASSAAPVAPQLASLLAAAHTHHGYLLMRASTLAAVSPSGTLESGPANLCGRTKDELEEMASRDFFLGGRFGDRTAREMSIRTNPYAKMCGAIVKEAMKKEMDEYELNR